MNKILAGYVLLVGLYRQGKPNSWKKFLF